MVRGVQSCVDGGTDRSAQFFIDFSQETVATILQLDDLVGLKLLEIIFVTRFFLRMITFIQHVAVVDSFRAAQYFDLVKFLLLFHRLCGFLTVAE